MRKLFTLFAATGLLLLAACADKQGVAERLTLVNNTIASTARVTETALSQDLIDVSAACKVEVYGRLARAATDTAFVAYAQGNQEGAADHLDAALQIINGTSAEAVAQANREC